MGRDSPEEESDTSGFVGTWYSAKVNPLQQQVPHQLQFVSEPLSLWHKLGGGDTSTVGVLQLLSLAGWRWTLGGCMCLTMVLCTSVLLAFSLLLCSSSWLMSETSCLCSKSHQCLCFTSAVLGEFSLSCHLSHNWSSL